MHHEVFEGFQFSLAPVERIEAGCVIGFLKVRTRISFSSALPGGIAALFPTFNEEYFEWIDVLEAVRAARDKFTMIELGAGWGRWLVTSAVALRHTSGLPHKLVGVEAEPTHFRWMKQHFRDNGIIGRSCQLVQAAIADKEGDVWFWTGQPADWYGQAIAEAPEQPSWRRPTLFRRLWSQISGEPSSATARLQRVRAISLNTLLGPLDRVDLIDLDIQGAEFAVLQSAVAQLDKKVKRVHIGTHSPEIETHLRGLFRGLGWANVNDYPSNNLCQTQWGPIKFQDGVQTWINPMM